MTRWSYEDVRDLYRRAEHAEARAEKAEVELARANARIATLHSKFVFRDGRDDPFAKRAADAMAAAVDVMVHRNLLDARSLVADARLDYGEPWSEEEAWKILRGED